MPPTPSPALAATPASAPLATPGTAPVTPPTAGADRGLRGFDDVGSLRTGIYDSVFKAVSEFEPVGNATHTVKLVNPKWVDPPDLTPKDRKRAILRNESLGRRLQAEWHLIDNASGQKVAARRSVVATVPKLTDGGTFVQDGIEYTLANQFRLLPGVYTRRKSTGETESHVNVLPGQGVSHRHTLDPVKSVFKIEVGQSSVPLLPVLRAMGATDDQLREAWGDKLLAANQAHDTPEAVTKLYDRLLNAAERKAEPDKAKAVAAAILKMRLDPSVTARTLGRPHETLGVDAVLDSTKRLLSVYRGEADPDDRDAMPYQKLMAPDDLMAERVRAGRSTVRKLLWKATNKKSLAPFPTGLFDGHIKGLLQGSGLATAAEEVNPLEMLGQMTRVTRLGEGGISGGSDAIPEESRDVHSSQLGYVDPVLTPESGRAGVDLKLAGAARRGKDGRLYTPVRDLRTGQVDYRSPLDLADEPVAFPGEMRGDDPVVTVVHKGRIDRLPRDQVRYEVPHMEKAFNPLANLVPGKSAIKGQRAIMGARMMTQAMALKGAETPLVGAADPDTGDAYEKVYGHHVGAVRAEQPGRVVAVADDKVTVRGEDGKERTFDLHVNLPYNRKSVKTQTPTVEVGQFVKPGDLLARSNYTDDKGNIALGRNLYAAYVPDGNNFEDAVTISASAARDKLVSEHLYQHSAEHSDDVKRGKNSFIALMPSTYSRTQLSSLDDDGVIKPGSVVESGQPLVLGARLKSRTRTKILRGGADAFSNDTQEWDHHSPGVVTDVEKTPKGVVVAVKAYNPMIEGDKLCYDPLTEVLTDSGWKKVEEVTTDDMVATLVDGERFRYLNPVATTRYHHNGRMYRLKTTQVDLLVTDNHKLYAAPRNPAGCGFGQYEPRQLFGKRYRLKKDGVWEGASPETIVLESVTVPAGQYGRGQRDLPPRVVRVETYAMLLGMFLSEGSTFCHRESGSYGFDICQYKTPNVDEMLTALDEAGVSYTRTDKGVRVHSLQWYRHFKQLGRSWEKYIPPDVFSWDIRVLRILYRWLMWGDGHEKSSAHSYCTTSPRLADDVQRLALHIGMSAIVRREPPRRGKIKGVEYDFRARYDVRLTRSKNRPEINHGHKDRQSGQLEEWQGYEGQVYCVTMPVGHVIYVRRNGKPVWCGNSGRFGDKGLVKIVPDEHMPHDSQGRPFEVLLNPLGVQTRGNPIQVYETVLSKIAKATGKPYALKDFDDIADLQEYTRKEAEKHGVSDTETITDPRTGVKIPGVLTGYRYMMKLHHAAEDKDQGRGLGGYTCFDDQTEVLTRRGWVSWPDVQDDDEFATVVDEKWTYQRPSGVVRENFSGELVGFVGRYLDYLVTDNHRMWIKTEKKSHFEFQTAGDLYGRRFYVRQFGWKLPETGPDSVTINAAPLDGSFTVSPAKPITLSADDYAALIGWYVSEGHVAYRPHRREYKVYLHQSQEANPEKFAEISDLARRCGLNYHLHRDRGQVKAVVISSKTLAHHLKDFGALAENKRLTPFVMSLPETARLKMLDALMKGDGSHCQGHVKGFAYEHWRYTTISERLADDVQTLAIQLGMSSTIRRAVKTTSFTRPGHPARLVFTVSVGKGRKNAAVRNHKSVSYHYRRTYNGVVYCATIPSGLLYVRRNGKPILTGNSDGEPARGSGDGGGAKRFSVWDTWAMLSHGALAGIRDAKQVRGQKNEDYWAMFQAGHRPPDPDVPHAYKKFVSDLRASGINPVRQGTKTRLLGMTDKDVEALTEGRVVQSAESVNWNEGLDPIRGGLFDQALTGSHGGKKWSAIQLHEPVLNPVFEDPARRLLGLTKAQLREVMAGDRQLNGQTGHSGLQAALKAIDVPKELEKAKAEFRSGKKTRRDEAVKRWALLEAADKHGVHPGDWVLSKVPVLPPVFRPVSLMQGNGRPMTADANLLYKELFDANHNLKQLSQHSDQLRDERLAVYDAFKGVVGLGDPTDPKNKERGVSGILKSVFGSSPKYSHVQRKLLGTTVDTVGRSVIVPNADLDMDQAGIPENKAWDVFKPFVVRRLVRQGMTPVRAAEMISNKDQVARRALQAEMEARPIRVTRAPILHRYGTMAFRPVLVPGHSIHLPPVVYKGFGADNDGDQVNYHVPVSDDAVKEDLEKLLPSKNLFNVRNFSVHQLPQNEFLAGLYEATQRENDTPPVPFDSVESVVRALRRGHLRHDQRVTVPQ